MEDNLNRYFKDIRKSKPLSPEEEISLAVRIQAGDQNALNSLVEANTRFVVTIARTYQGRGMSLEDLICEGNLGLIEAAKKYDPNTGYRFISYAVYWIKQAILFALNNNRDIRLPMNRVCDLNNIKKLREEAAEKDTCISDKDIAKQLGISIADVRALDRANRASISIDLTIGDDEDGGTLEGIIKNEDADIDSDLSQDSLSISIDNILNKLLTDKEVDIVKRSFGIDCKELTDDDIAKLYGVSAERIRQIKFKAIGKLRKDSNVLNSLRGYLG